MIHILLLFLSLSTPGWGQQNSNHLPAHLLDLSLKADLKCFEPKPVGPCVKLIRKPPVGVLMRFWQPTLLMETRATSSHHFSGSNLKFNEVQIYDFPLDDGFEKFCSDIPNRTLGIRYVSEADSIPWRKATVEGKLPQSLAAPVIGPQCHRLPLGAGGQCMKNWGPLYPRQGFVIAASEAVASVVNALRAVSIAGDPLPGHVVTSRLSFQPNISIDKVQMLHPAKTRCFPIGENPSYWDKQSKDGHYVWIFWRRRDCCV